MSIIAIPNTFTVGAVIVAAQHNANFSTIYSDYNGNITTVNLSPTAAIVDTQLNQITSASKVSGTALTGLASIIAGAGVIPTANLPTPPVSSVTNYGTSGSTGSTVLSTALKIVYGYSIGANTGGTSITNLPFTSNTSYVVIIIVNQNSATSQIGSVSYVSGSQCTLYLSSSGDNVSWLAIGS